MTTVDGPAAGVGRIAGFWRRLLAFFLDGLALGLVGSSLGLFLFDVLAGIGGWGRVLGSAIALAYLGLMNSRICGGQTLGKRALGIEVVSSSGAPLSVAASFCRSGILCATFFTNGAPLPAELQHPWLLVALGLLVFGVGLSIAYLFIFNRVTRQSLHDLAVGSYVVRTGAETLPVLTGAPWRGHYVVVVALMALTAAAPIIMGRLSKAAPFAPLLSLQRVLASEPGVRYVMVQAGTNSFFSGAQEGTRVTTGLSIQVVIDSKAIDQEALADRMARIALDRYADASGKDVINVKVSYGYDIGIASAWRSQAFTHSPAEWRARP